MRSARTWLVIALTGVTPLPSCKQKVEPAAIAQSPTVAAPSGPLTLPRLKQARLAIKVPGRFADAVSAVQATLGPPTTREPTHAGWAMLAGQDCHELAIDAHPNGALRAAGITSANQAMKARYDACVAKAGGAAK